MTMEKMLAISRDYGFDPRFEFGECASYWCCGKQEHLQNKLRSLRGVKYVTHYNTKGHIDGLAIFYNWGGYTHLYATRYTSEKAFRELCQEAADTPRGQRWVA